MQQNNFNEMIQLKTAQEASEAAKQKSNDILAQINKLKSKIDKKPYENSKVQTHEKKDIVVSIESVQNKPKNADKAQELAVMEQALAKATEEAHKQRVLLTGVDTLGQETNTPV
jgi:hypothetical protein